MAEHCRLTGLTVASGGISRLLSAAAPQLLRIVQRLSCCRASSSSAAAAAAAALPQFDHDLYYDYDSEEEREKRGNRCSLVQDTDYGSAVPLEGIQWAFVGDPNAKKHVYAELVSRLLKVPRISIGSLVRQELSPSSFLYKQIANAVNTGKLVPESIIFGLLSKTLDELYCRGENGFILDGIPRTRMQAEILEELTDINLVVNFKCPADQNMALDDAQSKISSFYKEQNKLLEDYYSNQNRLINFQVGSAPRETWKGLLAVLHLQHINAARISRTLSAGGREP